MTPVPIPVAMEPGKAQLRMQKIYRCNPLHWIWPIWNEGMIFDFDVLPGDPSLSKVDQIPNAR
jgi:hypothetical protein